MKALLKSLLLRPGRHCACGTLMLLFAAGGTARAQLFGVPPASSDVKQGAEMSRLVEEQIGLSGGTEMRGYVQQLGARLAEAANDPRWKFSFQIVDQGEPNAFALPGGGVYVSRGLLALVTSEDELAGILGHEIGHVTKRHSSRQQRKGFLPGLLSVPGNVVGGLVGENIGNLINAPIDMVGGAWLSRYSRSQESEADSLGVATASRAGYDPSALATILARLERDVAMQTGQQRRFTIFDSHPLTSQRLQDIQRHVQRLTVSRRPGVAADQAALYQKLDGLWWGENPEAGAFVKNKFVHPVVGFTLTFPEGWKTQNTPRYIVSIQPQQEALLILGVAGPEAEPEAVGQKFIEKMRRTAGTEPVTTRKMNIGAYPAFVATYLERSGRPPTYLHLAWVAMAGHTYQLIGLAPEQYRETLRNAAFTLRPLTDVERRSVTGKRLRIVAASDGEHLSELNARTGNVWPPDYTAMVNGLESAAPLAAGRLIKIAREESIGP
jgi:predicted Zn-dependent protease